MRVFTVERTLEREWVIAVLDRLARAALGGPTFDAALAATLDGGRAVMAVTARDPKRVERISSERSRAGPGPGL